MNGQSLFAVMILLVTYIPVTKAKQLPLFEFGVGGGGLYQPYYPGASQARAYAFPVFLPVYRGRVFKSDEKGLRAELIEESRYSFDLSMDFNLAIDSDDVDVRKGMDDIDSIVEFGPSLEIVLAKHQDRQWLLALPVRGQLQVGSDRVDAAGYTFSPAIYRYQDVVIADEIWTANVSLAAKFMTSEASDVFYQVDQNAVAENRPFYDADGGYAGLSLQGVLRSRNEKRLLVLFLRVDMIDGASFDDSPLVKSRHGVSAGVIYSHFLFKSKRKVDVD